MSDVILEAQELTKEFAGFFAVNGVNLRILRGGVHALIGPNGAGKTTCFNLISKFLTPSSGRIIFDGQDTTELTPDQVARLGLVRSFQISSVFTHLTVRENLHISLQRDAFGGAGLFRSIRALKVLNTKADELAEAVGLADAIQTTSGLLPYGKKRALELAMAVALEPKILLLDEPTSGLGREDIDRIVDLIKVLAQGRTVVMVEHNLAVVEALAKQITVLAGGEVLAEGNYEELSRDPKVIAAYLGTEEE
jgi:branched-chain amino acid transport system ATP-binding protein